MKDIKNNSRKGFTLVLSLLSATILVILMVPYISRVVADYRFTTKIYNSNVALDVAEAGIERALWEIRYNNAAFSAASGWTTATDGSGNRTCTVSNSSFQTSAGDNLGAYDINAFISSDLKSATVTATGYVPAKISYDERRKIMVTYAKYNFSSAVMTSDNGPKSIELGTQGSIDSYDSSQGTYAATQNSHGNIETNGEIKLNVQAKVWGDANPGPSYPFSSKPKVTGSWGTIQAPIVIDPIPQSALDSAIATNNNNNIEKENPGDPDPLNGFALNLATQKNVTLPGGTYYFTSITIGTQAHLNITGPSVIYVAGGDVIVGTQGSVNNTGVPSNLTIYSTGATINLTTQTDLYAAIYAPNAAVSLTTQGDIYGAVVSKTFYSGTQAGVHFDQALLSVSPVFASNGVTSWQEIQ